MLARSSLVRLFVLVTLASGLVPSKPALAATGTRDTLSPLGGNGHNVSFDGRLFVVTRGANDATGGWFATLLRPENVAYDVDGFPDLTQGAFSDFTHIQPTEAGENALALCEADPTRAPFACDDDGNASASGAYDCYELWVIDSNAHGGEYNGLRRRQLTLWVASPRTASAAVHKWQWSATREPLTAGGDDLRGIEPTVTKDGKLLVWQGHPDNDGRIDILMYATNDNPCAASGWDGPHDFAHMVNDPRVNGVYALGERPLRAADGQTFRDRDLGALVFEPDSLHGAYPWLFPDGEALIFTSVVVPCRAENDPGGCGARRGGIAVLGYPTNWAVAHVDGAVNPSTDDEVRLFFSSPGPFTFDSLPVTEGADVWPFFGSNTQNYTEIVFDDGLDGQYAGVWHMNESVTRGGDLDRTKTPDTSGYFNTGTVHGGAYFPAANNGPRGKALVMNGTDAWVSVPHSSSLNAVNGITIEMTLRLDAPVDCDVSNNYRLLLGKGNIGDGAYTIVLEEGRQLHARVKVAGEQRSLVSTAALVVDQWHEVAFAYDAASGVARFVIDGEPAGEATFAPGTLDGSLHALTLGGPGAARAACPVGGDGAFAGTLEEVRISRVDRFSPLAPPAADAGVTDDAGAVTTDSGAVTIDSGAVTTDSGAVTIDSGAVTIDSGAVTGDSGAVTGDSGWDDVGAGDGGPSADGGGDVTDPGCGCAATPDERDGAPALLALGLALLGVLRRRRR